MVGKVHLKIAVAEAPHTAAVRNGSIPIEGVDAEIITMQPQIGAFRRMVRQVEFDVCEIAPTTYIIARAYGAPFVALPLFFVRPDAGIKTPKDLEGKKVGVRPYSVTTGVWTRSVLAGHPWVAKSLFDAFSAGKNQWLASLKTDGPKNASDQKYLGLMPVVGPDPLPYGIEQNIKTIEALERTAHQQALTPRRMTLQEFFVDPEGV